MVDEGELDENPMKTLSPPQPQMKPVPVITDAELGAVLKACKGRDFRDRRDEAIIRMLLDCGLRVSELCGLRIRDVNLDQEMAIVTGKGNKVRPTTTPLARPRLSIATCGRAVPSAGVTSRRSS